MRGGFFVRTLVAVISVAAAGAMQLGTGAGEARACSIAPMSARYLPDLLQRTQVAAIGTWMDASEDSVTLHVDQALKGAQAGDEFAVNNREPGLSASCATYYDSRLPGYRFKDGGQAIVLLEKQADGLWQPGWFGLAVFAMPTDELEPLRPDLLHAPAPVTIESVRAEIQQLGDVRLDPGFESRGPCNPPFAFERSDLRDYLAMSPLVVIGQVTAVQGGSATVRVDEALRGTAGSTVTVNGRELYQDSSCSVLMDELVRLRSGEDLLLFLKPDEFGVAEYRPSAWGRGLAEVNEKYVTQGMFALRDLAQSTGSTVSLQAARDVPMTTIRTKPSIGSGKIQPDAAHQGTGDNDSSHRWGFWVAGGGALLAAAFVTWFARKT